ncbi:Hypothetical predicted protein, partial [Cloeon dipterum]
MNPGLETPSDHSRVHSQNFNNLASVLWELDVRRPNFAILAELEIDKMRWIWLCAVLLIVNNLHKTNGDDLNKGLFFKERGEVYATTDTWNIQIPLNTKIFTTA